MGQQEKTGVLVPGNQEGEFSLSALNSLRVVELNLDPVLTKADVVPGSVEVGGEGLLAGCWYKTGESGESDPE